MASQNKNTAGRTKAHYVKDDGRKMKPSPTECKDGRHGYEQHQRQQTKLRFDRHNLTPRFVPQKPLAACRPGPSGARTPRTRLATREWRHPRKWTGVYSGTASDRELRLHKPLGLKSQIAVAHIKLPNTCSSRQIRDARHDGLLQPATGNWRPPPCDSTPSEATITVTHLGYYSARVDESTVRQNGERGLVGNVVGAPTTLQAAHSSQAMLSGNPRTPSSTHPDQNQIN
jgi:hypothetical protein